MLNFAKRCGFAGFALAVSFAAGAASAQQAVTIKMGRLAFPSLSSVLLDVVVARGFDKANGVNMQIGSFGAVSAYYGALASGEVEMLTGGPHVFQKMMLEGVPIQIAGTWARLNALGVISRDPAIKTIADLKGKSIAADMGSSEYQILSIYGRKLGIVFGKDISVVQAGPPLARTQLQAERVEAAMIWEPTLTVALRDNPNYKVILTGDTAWKAIDKSPGWELVLAMREDFLKKNAAGVPKVLKMLQDAAQYIKSNPDAADEIVVNSLKLPKGVFKEGVTSGRIDLDIRPAWGEERAVIDGMLKVAVESGYLPKHPGEKAIYKP